MSEHKELDPRRLLGCLLYEDSDYRGEIVLVENTQAGFLRFHTSTDRAYSAVSVMLGGNIGVCDPSNSYEELDFKGWNIPHMADFSCTLEQMNAICLRDRCPFHIGQRLYECDYRDPELRHFIGAVTGIEQSAPDFFLATTSHRKYRADSGEIERGTVCIGRRNYV